MKLMLALPSNLKHIVSLGFSLAFIATTVFFTNISLADETVKHGAVMARTMALDDNNQPILVEYNEDGSEGAVIGIPSEYKKRVTDLQIINAADYQYQLDRLSDYRDHHRSDLAKDAEVMNKDEFLGQSFTTANGQSMALPNLPDYVKSVLVRGRSNRILNQPDQLVLLSFTVDLSQSYTPPQKGTLLLDPKGRVITSSSLNIAPRIGFFGDANKPQEFLHLNRNNDDKIFGPVPGIKVYVAPEIFPGSLAATDDKGKYVMRYFTGFCPAIMDMETDIWAELHYANFSPYGMPLLPFYLRRQDWTTCWDPQFMGGGTLMAVMAYVDVLAIKATMAVPNYNIDLKVDVMFLSGKVFLKNPDGSNIDIGDKTEYSAHAPETTPKAEQFYDLDGDGHPDGSILGTINSNPQPDGSSLSTFTPTADGNIQGVYLSSHGGRNGQPDLVRLADTEKKLEHTGFLKSISKDDLKKTDILVFRESTGELVLDRKGLENAEIDGRLQEGLGKDDKYFFYRLMLRGPMDSAINVGGTNRSGTWEEWSTRNKLAEPFRKRESDYLKPGEWIRLVVINRVTGYMGTQRIQLSDASKNKGNYLNVPLNDTYLMPPHLKMWAERNYDVDKGLTAGEERHFIIGAEGVGLSSDALIQVYSEWFDENDRPLPEGLGAAEGAQYGLTGRLAKVAGNNNLQEVAQSQLANFPIAPGHHTQILRVKDNLSAPEHFYIHVSGTQKNENPDFSKAGNNATAPFDSRPRGLTPFLTPLFNEDKDWYSISAWNQAKQAFNSGASPIKPIKPLPVYEWGYRPEYQFSQYQLEVNEISRTTAKDGDVSLLNDANVQLGSKNLADQLINVFYSLISNKNDRLTSIDGNQDLVLAIGQEEIKLTVGTEGQIHFDNLEHLAHLAPEDFLTMRLYSNQDAGNILWEFAFDTLGSAELSRSYSLAQYNDEPALKINLIDSFQVLNIPLETESIVQIEVLDTDKHSVKTLVSAQKFPLGMQNIVVLRKDLEDMLPRAGIDGYISIKTSPTNGEKSREKLYSVDLNTTIHGNMLGQIIQYDTLIQRGSLTLRREDMALPGAGPQLDFSRSFSNEPTPENNKSVLSPGWSHNQDVYVQVLAYGDGQPPYENNLPGWIKDTRDGPFGPKILSSETLANLMTHDRIPTVVTVSNSGSFKLVGNSWIAQRGNHGTLGHTSDGSWEYVSKDGTSYKFAQEASITGKHHVKTVTDRNGNALIYNYTFWNGEQFVTSITDPAKRKLSFSYSLADNGHFQLDKVENSVGVTLEFSYFKTPKSGYDLRTGMLQSFKRGTFTETYNYSQLPMDPSVNLSTTMDANGHVTRYEYYAEADVPALLGNYVPGLNKNDVVHKVYYPSTQNDVAEITYPVTASQNIREVSDLRQHKTKYTLNILGNPTKQEEPEGKTTTFEWSADMGEPDNLLRKKTDVSISANWEYQYDAKGNLSKEIDPYGNTTEQSWDQKYTVLLYRKDKNGNVLENHIDANGNVTSEIQSATINGSAGSVEIKHTYGTGGSYKGLLRTTTNGRGFITKFDYDTYGTLASAIEPEGSSTTYENNPRGMRLTEKDATGNITKYEYDDLDRLTRRTDAEDNTVEYSYDAKGNKKSEITHDNYLVDDAKHIRYLKLAYNYDARDRVSDVTRTGNLDGSYRLSGSKSYTYDANSNLLSETDWKNVATRYQYDALNRRTVETNREGRTTNFNYVFSDGFKTTTTDPAGHATVQETDKLGRRIKIQHPAVSGAGTYSRVFHYDKMTNVTEVIDENGNSTQNTYDGRNLKLTQINAENKTFTWNYDAAGNVVKTIDELGRNTSYTYDKQNRQTTKVMPTNKVFKSTYNLDGTLVSETDPWNFTHTYTYNKIKQRTGVTNPDNTHDEEGHANTGELVYHKDAANHVVTQLVGPDGRLFVSMDAVGRQTLYSYDDNKNLIDQVLSWGGAATGPTNSASNNEYDAMDRVKKSMAGFGSSAQQEMSFEYDVLGNKTKMIRPDGRVVNMKYDELNRVIEMTDALGRTTKQTWDGLGNKLSITDRRGNTTSTEYDVLNRPVKITDAKSQFNTIAYDAVGNVLTETDKLGVKRTHTYDGLNRELTRRVDGPSVQFQLVKNEYDISNQKSNSVTDANGNKVTTDYNWRGQVLVTHFPGGAGYSAATVENTYDDAGFLTQTKDEAGYVTRHTYFADGSVQQITNAENESTQFTYDLYNNKATVIKPLSGVETFTYDALSRLVEVRDTLGGITSFTYDGNNNQITQTTPTAGAGTTTVTYAYDLLNRKIEHRQPGNLVSHFEYDEEGNLIHSTDPKGQSFARTYDVINRVTNDTFPSGDITSIDTAYDANNNVLSIVEHKAANDETTSNTFDGLNRLTAQTQRGRALSYSYDNNGNRLSVTTPGGSTTYAYDARNRLKTVNAGAAANYAYNANGWLQQLSQANGTKATYTYDSAGRTKTIVNALSNGNVLSQFTYAYDANGNRTQQIETQNGFLTVQSQTTDYVFDELDRLKTYTETAGSVVTTHALDYFPSYDRKSEKVTKVDGSTTQTITDREYTYNGTHWLTDIAEHSGSGGSIHYDYDPNGNTTHKTDSVGAVASVKFKYNTRNQLIEVAQGALNSEASQGQYDYNYAGMRIRSINSERGDIEYVYDGKSIVDELQNNSTVNVAHYRYGDRLLSLNNAGQEQFYHYEALGTVANLTNGAGEKQIAYRTDIFGKITQQEGTSVNRHVFTGKEIDEKTGLIYFGARFYDPDTARFINQDTYLGQATSPPSLHRYLYGYSNPTLYIDSTGNADMSGHYYIPFYVALKVGFSPEEASKIALHSQIPDQVGRYDATALALNEVSSIPMLSSPIGMPNFLAKHNDRVKYQSGLHVLTATNAVEEGDHAAAIVNKTDRRNLAKIGTALHPLVDSYIHIDGDGPNTVRPLTGHVDLTNTDNFNFGADTDYLHMKLSKSMEFTQRLAEVLSKKTGKSLSKEDISGMQKEILSAVEQSKTYKTVSVPEYVSVGSNPFVAGGTYQTGRTVNVATDELDNGATNDAVHANLRALVTKTLKNNPQRDPKKSPEDYLVQPEKDDLPQKGIGRGRGDELADIRSLMKTGSKALSDDEVKKIQRDADRATDEVSNEMNAARNKDKHF